MLKKFSKFLLLLLFIFVISSSSFMCLADEIVEISNTTTSENNQETESTNEDLSVTEDEIHYGDLYLFDNNDIVMDKVVYGNVFIFGNNVEITGQINGNLFVLANNINFNQCAIRYSIFACAPSIYYNGGCGSSYDYSNLYVATNKLETTYDSYVTGDIKVVASDVILRSAIGGNADLLCDILDIGENEDVPMIFGDLRYTANNEISIPEGVLVGTGTVTYTNTYETSSVFDILISFLTCIFTTLVIYFIIKKFTPNFTEKLSKQTFSVAKLLKAFVIGIVSILIVSILIIMLLITSIGLKLAFIIALLYISLVLIAVPILAISITNILKSKLKIDKISKFCLVLVLVSVILHGITAIPFVGELIALVINITAIGLLIDMYLPHKELTDEEKAILEERKKLTQENKAKNKQEKLETKATKKQAKLEAKKIKKEDK